MKPRRTPSSTQVFRLPGGNEDSDVWVEQTTDAEEQPVIVSVWDLDDAEREGIANGGTIELMVWGSGHPPVSVAVGPSLEDRKEGEHG